MWSIDWSLSWSTYSSYRKSESFSNYESNKQISFLNHVFNILSCRIPQHIGKVIKHVKLYSVYMEFHFLILNNLKNGNIFKKKQLNEIIERLVSNKISFFFTNLALDHVFFNRKAHIFTINLSNFFEFVSTIFWFYFWKFLV
jgi:hypothetical protein